MNRSTSFGRKMNRSTSSIKRTKRHQKSIQRDRFLSCTTNLTCYMDCTCRYLTIESDFFGNVAREALLPRFPPESYSRERMGEFARRTLCMSFVRYEALP